MKNGILSFRNLGSTNGSHLNGRRTEHAVISDGDVLRIGDFLGIVRLCSGRFQRCADEG